MRKEIICKNCKSKYELSYQRIPTRDTDTIECRICGELLYSWSEAKVWSASLIEENKDFLKHK